MEYGVTDKGFILKRFDDCVSGLRASIKEYTGIDLDTDDNSLLNLAFVYPIADVEASLHEENQDVYHSYNPASATGVSLDNACQSTNIVRAAARKTSYMVHCNCTDGSTVVAGTTIAADTNPRYDIVCAANTKVERGVFNEAYIRLITAEKGQDYIVTIDGIKYKYTSITDDGTTILQGIKDAIAAEEYDLEINENILSIRNREDSNTGTLALSNNLTTDSITSLVSFLSTDYNSTVLPAGTITNIISNLSSGLNWVENRLAGAAGREEAEDWELRQDFIAQKYVNSRSLTESTKSYLLSKVTGVTRVVGSQNDEDYVDADGLLPHSVMFVVEGGDEEEIAAGIFTTKTGGINTNGSIAKTVYGDNNEPVIIRFNRPEYIYTWLQITITGTAVSPDYESATKELIIEKINDLEMGDKLVLQSLATDLFSEIAGVEYVDIMAATSLVENDIPAEGDFTRKNIEVSKIQKVELNEYRIEVILVES